MIQGNNIGTVHNHDNSSAIPSVVAAVFDVDRTLVPITTTERIFIRYLLRHGNLRMKAREWVQAPFGWSMGGKLWG